IAVGTALGAIAQRWSWLRVHGATLGDLDWTAYAPFALLAALCARDLEERFDFAPTGIRWLPNLWGDLPRSDARRLRWCAYALAVTAALLFKELQVIDGWGSVDEWQAQLLVIALGASVALLAAGRASVLLAIPPLCIGAAVLLVPDLAATEAA